MEEGYYDWLPPRELDEYENDLYGYDLIWNGVMIWGGWSKYDIQYGDTVYVVRSLLPSQAEDFEYS